MDYMTISDAAAKMGDQLPPGPDPVRLWPYLWGRAPGAKLGDSKRRSKAW